MIGICDFLADFIPHLVKIGFGAFELWPLKAGLPQEVLKSAAKEHFSGVTCFRVTLTRESQTQSLPHLDGKREESQLKTCCGFAIFNSCGGLFSDSYCLFSDFYCFHKMKYHYEGGGCPPVHIAL